MRKIMIFQHVGHEPLGTLNPMLKAAGFRIRYVNFGRDPMSEPDLEGYSGLIVLGGPMGVYEAPKFPHLKYEMKKIEEALKRGIPVLGICLGAQLVASVLGAQVRKNKQWELGWYKVGLTEHGQKDPLFGSYGESESVFQLHQDHFDPPKTATHLAFSELAEGQAFRYGEKVYGLQFHLEADQPMIRRWLAREENQKLMRESGGLFTPSRLEADTQSCIERSLQLSSATFSKFIELFGEIDRHVILGSRS
jgi:GMP synthase (glutamine-hydrolysing)